MPGIAAVSVGSIKVASRVPLGSFAKKKSADQSAPGTVRPGRLRGCRFYRWSAVRPKTP